MTTTRPEVVDDHGTVHRHGCPEPGWTTPEAGAVAGWCVIRCTSCGTVRLVRGGRQ